MVTVDLLLLLPLLTAMAVAVASTIRELQLQYFVAATFDNFGLLALSSLVRILGERFDHSFPACAFFFFFFFFFFFQVEIHFSRPGSVHYGSAS